MRAFVLCLLLAVPSFQAAVRAPGCDLPASAALPQRSWAQDRLAVERVYPLTRGEGQQIAVVDSGVDGNHPQLRGHVSAGVDVLTGAHRADTDCVGHGTFVAGIIAAQPAPGVGFVGVAPGAVIVPIRETNSTDVTGANLALAIQTASQLPGIRAINVSTTTAVDDPRVRVAVGAAQAADVVVVAAAGNDAQAGDPAKYPAAYPGVLSVGAIDSSGQRSQFSETVGVSVVAPGQDLISTAAGGTGLVSAKGGTSFAAPYVTGVVALVRAYHPRLTAAQVIHRIQVTADHPPGPLPDPQYGWGVVDPYAAVTAVLPEEGAAAFSAPPATPLPPPAQTPAGGSSTRLAAVVALAALAIAGVGAVLAVLVPLGRRRGWRPARSQPR
jgi:type VII secretion-associated serine protease mycosin